MFNSYVCLPESRTLRNLSQTGIVGICPKWSNIAISKIVEPSGGLCIAMFIMFEVFQSYPLLLHIIFAWNDQPVDLLHELDCFGLRFHVIQSQ